jgi:hypothetical protein
VAERSDRDWQDDERAIEALAAHLGLSADPSDYFHLEAELERLWRLPQRPADLVEWRRRAWFYRRLAVELAQHVAGFRREPTPGETRRKRWTRQHMVLLLDAVDKAKRILRRESRPVTDAAALRFLLSDGPYTRGRRFLPPDMTFLNAKKLLGRARSQGK